MLLDRMVLAACSVVSKESHRAAMKAVKLEKNKAIATDGYRLVEVILPNFDPNELPSGNREPIDDECLVDGEELAEALKLIKPNKKMPALQTAWQTKAAEGYTKIVSTNLKAWNEKEVRKTEDQYPAYEKIKVGLHEKPVVAKISVNPKLLAELLKGIADGMKHVSDYPIVTLEIRGEMEPLVIQTNEVEGRKIEALIMPIRNT